jgi:hypothetical protein
MPRAAILRLSGLLTELRFGEDHAGEKCAEREGDPKQLRFLTSRFFRTSVSPEEWSPSGCVLTTCCTAKGRLALPSGLVHGPAEKDIGRRRAPG